jgi:hypothetical protein
MLFEFSCLHCGLVINTDVEKVDKEPCLGCQIGELKLTSQYGYNEAVEIKDEQNTT